MYIKIASDEKNIRPASSQILGYVENIKKDIDKNILFDIKLCIEEAVRNAIIHGNKHKRDLPVEIHYDVDKGVLEVTVEDKGNGFDVKNLPDPTDLKNLFKESGRGVYIMHRLMDEVTYSKKGNRVTMKKRLF